MRIEYFRGDSFALGRDGRTWLSQNQIKPKQEEKREVMDGSGGDVDYEDGGTPRLQERMARNMQEQARNNLGQAFS